MATALANETDAQIISTGIDAVDVLLGGGLPRRSLVLVCGNPGTGKTVLCSQIAFAKAAEERTTLFATVTSETNEKLASQLRSFSFFDEGRLGNEVFLVSAYPWISKGPSETKDRILRAMRERSASLLVLDGLRSLRDLWQKESELRNFYYELGIGLSQMNATGILTAEYSPDALDGMAEATTVDGIVCLSMRAFGESVLRRISVSKLRGRAHLVGEHPARLTTRGFSVIPRLEARLPRGAERSASESAERVAFGIAELDALMHGGPPERSATLLFGGTGAGKSLIALSFAVAGAESGQPALFVSHSEPAGVLVARAARVGFDVARLVESGTLRIVYRPLLEVESDDIADEILRVVAETDARRVVVDGVGELEAATSNPARARAFLTALTIHLRALGVTSLFVEDTLGGAHPDVEHNGSAFAATADNLVRVRQLEFKGRLHRVISILKMRSSRFDEHQHEFTIDERGIRLLDPFVRVEIDEELLSRKGRRKS